MAWYVEDQEGNPNGTPTSGGTPNNGGTGAQSEPPDILRKPEILEVLEAWFDDPEHRRERYDEAIASLDSLNYRDWMDPAAGGHGVNDEDVRHFEKHWLGQGNGEAFFPGVGASEVLERFQAGFTAAMTDARDNDLPINYVWVAPDTLQEDYVAISHVVGPTSVTATIVTSKPPPPPEYA